MKLPIFKQILDWILRYTFYPVFVAGAVGGHLILMRRFPSIHPALLGGAILTIAVAWVCLFEWLEPYRSKWNRPDSDFWTDFALTNLIFPVLVEGIEFGLKWIFGDQGIFANWAIWPIKAPLLLQLAMALVISEFFFYWIHRLGHERASLWKFHQIHHTPRRVYGMNAARFHPIDLGLNFFLYFLPLALLGVPLQVFALVFTINAVTGLLEHANIDLNAGWLNWVFNTAQLHRWHHSVEERESKCNYGKVLSIWDQVFGTFYLPSGKEVERVGVLEGGERVIYFGLKDAIRAPFQARRVPVRMAKVYVLKRKSIQRV